MKRSVLVRCLSVALVVAMMGTSCTMGGNGTASVRQTNQGLHLWLEAREKETFQPLLDQYQTQYPDVELTVEAVSIYGDFKAAKSKMATQLMSGEGPDLILVGFNYFNDVEKLMKAGVFAPMDSFLEADSDFVRTDFVEPVLDAGVYDGKQYFMPLGYQYRLALTTQEMVEETGFDVSKASADYFGFVEQMDQLFERNPDRRVLATAGSLGNFPNVMGIDLFDYKNGTVLLDTPEMKRACEYYKKLFAQDNDGQLLSSFPKLAEDLCTGKAQLYFVPGTAAMLQAAAAIEELDGTPVLIPYPAVDGTIGSVCESAFAIRANSPNQQNTYNLIRLFLTEEGQQKIARNNLPVRKTAIEQTVQREYETVSNGQENNELKALSEEYLALAMQVVDCHFTNTLVVSDFANGKMRPYFEGIASYEECMKDFIDYAEIYLSE